MVNMNLASETLRDHLVHLLQAGLSYLCCLKPEDREASAGTEDPGLPRHLIGVYVFDFLPESSMLQFLPIYYYV